MNKLSHCCKAPVEDIDWNALKPGEYPASEFYCTKCSYYCEEWKEKRDLKKEFEKMFLWTIQDEYIALKIPDDIWQWITDNFNPKS